MPSGLLATFCKHAVVPCPRPRGHANIAEPGSGSLTEAAILLDLVINAISGVLFAWFAGDRLRSDGLLTRPAIWLVLIFLCTVRVPMMLYISWVHPAWAWHYVVDPAELPLWLRGGAVFGQVWVFALMWFLAAWLMHLEKRRIVLGLLVALLAGAAAALITSAPRWLVYASYQHYREHLTLGIMDVKLGYALIVWLLGTGAAAAFVCVELRRDARRARA